MKRYDQKYFDRWYRGRDQVNTKTEVRRKVALAVAVAEFVLRHPIRNVLDVGCGEGAWLPHLRELRPRLSYTGVDPSDYVVARFGKSRNILNGGFGDLPSLDIRDEFDLIVCADALHYVEEADIKRGLPELVRRSRGALYLEVLTTEDSIIGDLDALIRRPAAWYRKTFERAGLTFIAPYCWASPRVAEELAGMERL